MSAAGIRHENKERKTGKMKKRLFAASMAFGLAIVLASCGGDNQTTSGDVKTTTDLDKTTTETKTNSGSYTIEVYDLDGELVGNETLSIEEYPTLWEGLNAKFDVEVLKDSYWLTSINQTVVDKSWSLMIYENDAPASTLVDGIVVDNGDKFTFKNECWNTVESGWGTVDSYEVLLDQAVYHYAKTKMKTSIASSTSCFDSTFWQSISLYNMMKNKYDSNLFNVNSYSDAYKESISSANLDDLPNVTSRPHEANYAKWYYAARLFDTDLTKFKEVYGAYLDGLSTYGSEYEMPFALSIAKELELDNKIKDGVKNPTSRASLQYGTDALAWQLTGMALYTTLDDSEFSPFTLDAINAAVKDFSADMSTSIANVLFPLVAMNKNPRDFALDESNTDIIKYLFDNCYDKENQEFLTEKLGDGDYSSNQIYASLMAYKIQRDQKKAVNIFA